MSFALTLLSWSLIGGSLLFFISGSLGLLRFPDVYCRLHAVTKADTLGLGLLTAGLVCRADSVNAMLLQLFIWLLVIASGGVSCHLLARYNRTQSTGADDRPRQIKS